MSAAGIEYGCWVRLGSYGDGSCEKLPEGGCRNCPEYQVVGLGLYDREPPEGYALEWTRILAGEKEVEENDAVSTVVFRVGGEWLGLRTARFELIARPRKPHSVPGLVDPAFLGLVNVHGELLPCLALDVVLRLNPEDRGEPGDGARLAVVSGEGGRYAFFVDEVRGVHRLRGGELREAPVTVSRSPDPMTTGVFVYRGENVGVIDEQRFFPALLRSLTG